MCFEHWKNGNNGFQNEIQMAVCLVQPHKGLITIQS